MIDRSSVVFFQISRRQLRTNLSELVEQTQFFTTKAQSRKGLIQDFRQLREFFVSWCPLW
jgi:hypothetical protein